MPAIWRDRDWDYYYLYNILYYKLKHMEEHFNRDNPTIVNSKQYAKQIMVAKNLAKRLRDNNYLSNALYWHDKKFNEVNFNDLISKEPVNGYYIYIGDQNKGRRDSFKICCEHSDYMESQDKEYLFEYMKKKINWWWD